MQSVTLYTKCDSVYKVPVMRVWHQMDSTGHGRDVSAARPQRSVRCPVPRTGAALGPARALRPDDLAAAAAASAIQRAAPQSVPHSHYWPPAAETRDHLSATVHPVLYTPCTVQPLYSNTPHTTVSLSATPRPWRRTLRYVQWNIFHTTSEIFLFLFYGTFNPRLWMTWMYLCSDNHHHDIVSILFIIYFLKIFPQGKNIFAYFTILQLFRAGAGVLLMIKLKIFLMLPRLSFQNNSYQKSDHDIKS